MLISKQACMLIGREGAIRIASPETRQKRNCPTILSPTRFKKWCWDQQTQENHLSLFSPSSRQTIKKHRIKFDILKFIRKKPSFLIKQISERTTNDKTAGFLDDASNPVKSFNSKWLEMQKHYLERARGIFVTAVAAANRACRVVSVQVVMMDKTSQIKKVATLNAIVRHATYGRLQKYVILGTMRAIQWPLKNFSCYRKNDLLVYICGETSRSSTPARSPTSMNPPKPTDLKDYY